MAEAVHVAERFRNEAGSVWGFENKKNNFEKSIVVKIRFVLFSDVIVMFRGETSNLKIRFEK